MPEGPLEIVDQGLRYAVDLAEGQKTGLYLDQRETAGRGRHERPPHARHVLLFRRLQPSRGRRGKAREVLGFDTSQRALAQAQANAQRNGLGNVRFESGDAFDTLHALKVAGERFDGIVLDPAQVCPQPRGRGRCLEGLRPAESLAIDVLVPGGILVTCSCSGHVTRDDFFFMLVHVAQQSGRDIQVLEQRARQPIIRFRPHARKPSI